MSMPYIMVSGTGKDKPGLTAKITEMIAAVNGNIVDIEAFSMRGLFAIFMILDCCSLSVPLENLKQQLLDLGKKISAKNLCS
jgi:predicted amino acid-binding ACT domain protein